ncbi:hypothetical protein FHQ18_07110 [Deferribacter autotrophicus]|uniref:tRNA(Ile)-lysidine/2-thiocytidine synthase N-terminal domain-containing protein n=1 Tax=Deferribacter autotrophicus TaxID=500465 RepID=A0A5A8F525_9BACT|nr:ATP-binding protein [Deferribacter autotrophicus]KAA0258155.1 hypothetical protein FHQ18_07110 [Deferribacter autotrophicus]
MSLIFKKIKERLIGSILKVNKTVSFIGNDLVVGVSGGVDSWVLWKVMEEYYKKNEISAKIYPVHVGISGDIKTKLALENVINVEVDKEIHFPIDCYQCSRVRREYIFKFCKEKGIKYILFAHHADDFAERFLWNLFYYKKLESLPICRSYFEGMFTIVRPFHFVNKKDIEKYARIMGYEDIEHKCSVKNSVSNIVSKISKEIGLNIIDVVGNINYIIEKYKIYGENDEK